MPARGVGAGYWAGRLVSGNHKLGVKVDNPKGGVNLLGRLTAVPAEHPDYPGVIVETMAANGLVTKMLYRDFDIHHHKGDDYAATGYYHSCRDLREVWVEDDYYHPMPMDKLYPFLTALYSEALNKRQQAKAESLRASEEEARQYLDLADSIKPTNVATTRVSGDCYAYAAELLIKRAVTERHVVPANCHELPWGRVPVWLDEQVGARIGGILTEGSWKQTDNLGVLIGTLWPDERPVRDRPVYRRSHWSDFNSVKAWSLSIWARLSGRSAILWGSPLVTTANLIAEKALIAKNLPPDRANEQRPLLLHVRRVAGLLSEQPWATEVIVAAALLRDVLGAGPAFSEAALRAEVDDAVVDLVVELRGPQDREALSPKANKRREKARLASLSTDAKKVVMAGWIDRLRDDRLDGARWGRLTGEVRSVADVVVSADEGLHQRLVRAWAGRRR